MNIALNSKMYFLKIRTYQLKCKAHFYAAQVAGAPHHEYIDKEHLCSSEITYPNLTKFATAMPPQTTNCRQIYIPNFKQIVPANPEIQVSTFLL